MTITKGSKGLHKICVLSRGYWFHIGRSFTICVAFHRIYKQYVDKILKYILS